MLSTKDINSSMMTTDKRYKSTNPQIQHKSNTIEEDEDDLEVVHGKGVHVGPTRKT